MLYVNIYIFSFQFFFEMNLTPEQYFYFYNQYPPTYINNYSLPVQDQNSNQFKYIESLQSQNKQLRLKVTLLEEKLKQFQPIYPQSRQQTLKIQKNKQTKMLSQFKCSYDDCNRTYKSSLALNLHIKMKHNGGSIRQRQAYAKLIFQCHRDGKPAPQININFPPYFLEKYKQKMLKHQIDKKEEKL